MKKQFTIFLVLFLWLLLFALSTNEADATTYSYTLTNLQSTSCTIGSEYTPMNLTSPGDIVQVFGNNFGNRSVDDYILEMIYLQVNTNKWEIYRGMRSEGNTDIYFGPISWTDNQINFEVKPGFGNLIGSDFILRIHSSSADNKGSCVRGILTPGLICTSFTYSNWTACQSNETQSRTVINSSPEGCTGGNPILTQSCSLPTPKIISISLTTVRRGDTLEVIGENFDSAQNITQMEFKPSFSLGEVISWSNTKILVKVSNGASTGANTVSFVYKNQYISSPEFIVKDACKLGDDWTCSDYGACTESGSQTRNCIKSGECEFLNSSTPSTTKNCTYIPPIPSCTSDNWSCASWSTCSSSGSQTRTCNKTSNCQGGASSPKISQSCLYTPVAPTCSADTWQCAGWGACSPQGIQTRTCTRTYDCPSVETAAPAVSQYCEAPNKPQYQIPVEDLGIVNQDSIVKATVKLFCPVSSTMAAQGSGTVIDSKGTILTNKHVINGTLGCLVGFIDNYSDEPYFGNRQIADIYRVSSDADIAILKLRNPSNKNITSIDITKGNSSNLRLGDQITTYGYPAKFGTKIKYTSGDFSGNYDGNYFLTTAIIDKGNSGGGAYLKNGTFVGIPSEVTPGYFNIMGKILSINNINNWINNSPIAYNSGSSNSYSRVSMLEDIDLNTLDSFGLFVAGDEANIKTETESQKIIAEEKKLITKKDNILSKRVSGNILLQVEKNGEGWYVYPDDKKKYYLGRPADAFNIMRNLGLGIKHSELANYLNTKFPSRLSGKIVLDVEQNGEAYYINPKNLKGYFLSRPADAFKVMRELGLGITNSDIRKIGVGEIK